MPRRAAANGGDRQGDDAVAQAVGADGESRRRDRYPRHAAIGPTVPMPYDPDTGVWTAVGQPGWNDKFYAYEVKVFTHTRRGPTRSSPTWSPTPTRSACRPTARAARSSTWPIPASSRPAGTAWPSRAWTRRRTSCSTSCTSATSAPTTPACPPPTAAPIMAFTDANSNGMQHLRALAQAGLTHVHLLPAFDIASVNEDKPTWQAPARLLLAAARPTRPSSRPQSRQSRTTTASTGATTRCHYTAPEGSYATNPDGAAAHPRVPRRWCKALHAQRPARGHGRGLQPHQRHRPGPTSRCSTRSCPATTTASNADGDVATTSCCAEHRHRAHHDGEADDRTRSSPGRSDYKVDGFRFDLMGHHMPPT